VKYQHKHIALDLDREQSILNSDGSITIYIPVTYQKIGGRNYIIGSNDSDIRLAEPKEHEPLISGVVKAFKWKQWIEEGKVSSMLDIAKKEKISESYICRMFRLTLLAPDIVKAILEGKQPLVMSLAECMKPFPLEWEAQRIKFGFKTPTI
jgi:hypothetical protein